MVTAFLRPGARPPIGPGQFSGEERESGQKYHFFGGFKMKDSQKQTRAAFVRSAVLLPALAGMLAQPSLAQTAKGSKSQFKYQDTPSGGKQCSKCTFFIAGKSATADGTCKIVEGDISPKGYCIAYAAKS